LFTNSTDGFYVGWSQASDNISIDFYEVYANNSLITTTTNTDYTYSGLTAGTDYDLKYCAVDTSSNKTCSSSVSTYTRFIVNLPSITSFSITSPYSQGPGSTLSINYAVSFGGAKPGTSHPQFGGVDIFTWSDQIDGTRYDGFNSGSSSGTSGTINITSLTGYIRVEALRVEILLPNTQRIYVLYYGDVREGSGDVDNKVICKSANALNPFGGSISRYEFNCPGTIVTPYTGNNQSGTTNSFFSNSIVGEYFNP
jgi:hypothetical protein